VRDLVFEKRVILPHLQNTVHVTYRILKGASRPRLELRPAFHFRHHEIPVNKGTAGPYKLTAVNGRYEIAPARPGFPALRMKLCSSESAFTIAAKKIPQVVYRIEQSRGYAHEGELWSPGFFYVDLTKEVTTTLIASTEKWEIVEVLHPKQALASERERRARWLEAGYILRTFAYYIRDGLIPNMFPDGAKQGLYHTADATLWFFHALARYIDITNDRTTLKLLLPALIDIIEQHLRGTKFNIH